MFGWEFPPYKSGGLGTACYDLTKGLAKKGVEVTFVMPLAPESATAQFVKLVGTKNRIEKVKIRTVKTLLTPYMTSASYDEKYKTNKQQYKSTGELYGMNLYEEVERFAEVAKQIAKDEDFDIIHAHDWMTYKAGVNAKKISGKPLVVHVHATEYDRSGGFNSHSPYEAHGLHHADKIITNSNMMKNNITTFYNVKASKIDVVHWGIEQENPDYAINYRSPLSKQDKIVLFLGRITIQKGPDYFIEVAKKVSEKIGQAKFVIAGSGDMLQQCINRAAELGIGDKVIFTGMLKGSDVHKAFQMADIYVMPSVSEPFGLVALESLMNNTPVIISKTSGASEVLNHVLKVDFWDVDEMANKIISVLTYGALHEELTANSTSEARAHDIYKPAQKVATIYGNVLGNRGAST